MQDKTLPKAAKMVCRACDKDYFVPGGKKKRFKAHHVVDMFVKIFNKDITLFILTERRVLLIPHYSANFKVQVDAAT